MSENFPLPELPMPGTLDDAMVIDGQPISSPFTATAFPSSSAFAPKLDLPKCNPWAGPSPPVQASPHSAFFKSFIEETVDLSRPFNTRVVYPSIPEPRMSAKECDELFERNYAEVTALHQTDVSPSSLADTRKGQRFRQCRLSVSDDGWSDFADDEANACDDTHTDDDAYADEDAHMDDYAQTDDAQTDDGAQTDDDSASTCESVMSFVSNVKSPQAGTAELPIELDANSESSKTYESDSDDDIMAPFPVVVQTTPVPWQRYGPYIPSYMQADMHRTRHGSIDWRAMFCLDPKKVTPATAIRHSPRKVRKPTAKASALLASASTSTSKAKRSAPATTKVKAPAKTKGKAAAKPVPPTKAKPAAPAKASAKGAQAKPAAPTKASAKAQTKPATPSKASASASASAQATPATPRKASALTSTSASAPAKIVTPSRVSARVQARIASSSEASAPAPAPAPAPAHADPAVPSEAPAPAHAEPSTTSEASTLVQAEPGATSEASVPAKAPVTPSRVSARVKAKAAAVLEASAPAEIEPAVPSEPLAPVKVKASTKAKAKGKAKGKAKAKSLTPEASTSKLGSPSEENEGGSDGEDADADANADEEKEDDDEDMEGEYEESGSMKRKRSSSARACRPSAPKRQCTNKVMIPLDAPIQQSTPPFALHDKRDKACCISGCSFVSQSCGENYRHREIHFEPRFVCPACGARMSRVCSLARHLRDYAECRKAVVPEGEGLRWIRQENVEKLAVRRAQWLTHLGYERKV